MQQPRQNKAYQATLRSVERRLTQILIPELQGKLLNGYRLVAIGDCSKAVRLEDLKGTRCVIAIEALDGLGINNNTRPYYVTLKKLEQIRLNASVVLRYLRAASLGTYTVNEQGNTWWSQITISPKSSRGKLSRETSKIKLARYERLGGTPNKPKTREKGRKVQAVYEKLVARYNILATKTQNLLFLTTLGPRQATHLCKLIESNKPLSKSLLVINWYDGVLSKSTKSLVEKTLTGKGKQPDSCALFISGEKRSDLVGWSTGLLLSGAFAYSLDTNLYYVSPNYYEKLVWHWKVPLVK